jgi:acetyl-CoA C-acetyltransferase
MGRDVKKEEKTMTDAYIYDAVRTPRGKGRKDGSLHEVTPVRLAVTALQAVRDRNNLDTHLVDDIVLGCVMPIGEQGADIARTASVMAGYAETVSGVQINRFCASGLEATNMAAAQVMSGQSQAAIGGGVESMSRVPMGSDGGAWAVDPAVAIPMYFVPQGVSADLIATKYGMSRDDVDSYAVESQRRAKAAWDAGYFKKSIVPVRDQNGIELLAHDEFLRPTTTMQTLAALEPSFKMQGEMMPGFNAVAQQRYPEVEKIHHVHHAGNSSGIVDGAAAILVGSKEFGEKAGLKPRARIRSFASIGSEPAIMLTGPAPASEKARRHVGGRHRPVRVERGVRRGRAALHADPQDAARQDQRERRRDRHGPSAGRHRRDDPRHAARRARAPQPLDRPRHAVRRRRHGHRHHHRARLRAFVILRRSRRI